MRKWIAIFLIYFSFTDLRGQDIHFSQFYNAPSNLNPAFTGDFEGLLRIHGNYRSQWSSVNPGVPFKTTGIFADGNDSIILPFDVNPGLALYHDKTGDSRFSTLQFNLFASKEIFEFQNDFIKDLRAGVMLGFSQRSINYDYLNFDNQFNGTRFDPTLSTGENFARNNYFYLNSSLGLISNLQFGDIKGKAGLATHNLIPAGQSFYKESGIILDRRYVITLLSTYPLNQRVAIEPKINYMSQGKFKELMIAALVSYDIPMHGVNLIGGLAGRTRDAGAIIAGIRKKEFTGTVSYDFNLSSLTPASNNRGGIEFSLIYIVPTNKDLIPQWKAPCQPYF